jgi:hypothetical protein
VWRGGHCVCRGGGAVLTARGVGQRYYMSIPEVYEFGLKLSTKLRDKIAELGLTKVSEMQVLRNALATPTGFDLHYGMFLPTINGQASDAQKDEWLSKVRGGCAATAWGDWSLTRC